MVTSRGSSSPPAEPRTAVLKALAARPHLTPLRPRRMPPGLTEQWVNKPSRERCLSCVESKSTPMQVKRTCAYCVGNKRTAEQGQKCVACLQGLPKYADGTSACLK